VNRSRTLVAKHGLDALIVLLALAAGTGTLTRPAASRPDGGQLILEAAAVVVMILALLARRMAPLVVPTGTWLVSAALSFVDGRLIVGQAPVSIAGMVAAVLLGNLRDERQARVGLVVVVTGAAAVVYNDPTHTPGNLVFIPVLFAVGWLVGFALRERTVEAEAAQRRAAEAERERQSAARIAVAEERARIARELHDVVAHSVSVMVLQVGAVRHRMSPADGEDREALQNVEQAGRTALAEMRRLLDAMRGDEEQLELAPQPGLSNLDNLLEHVRAAGLDVELRVHGSAVQLPPGLDLSAYRIVQEGLTNALKHAGARHAEVHIRYGHRHLELEVRDDGRGLNGEAGAVTRGYGLVGIGERVKLYQGELSLGSSETGGLALRARLPLEEVAAR
jgi:signal transduction histidine kinase